MLWKMITLQSMGCTNLYYATRNVQITLKSTVFRSHTMSVANNYYSRIYFPFFPAATSLGTLQAKEAAAKLTNIC